MQREIKLFNTKSKSIETFIPIIPEKVGIYSCGPTVYHYAHIGNLRAYVFADILHRVFTHNGYTVKHVINITDVGHLVGDGDEGEDKLEAGSKREGISTYDVAKQYEEAFMRDLVALSINKDEYLFPRATDNIPEQIELIKILEEKGYTYTLSDGVYFDTSKFPDYAKLAGLDIDGLQSGARVEENKEKRNITDFALWKFSPVDEIRQMEWNSPWGVGFPGWHIECSAMSMKLLGNHFDIHTGGIDHIPVHHTNELAQSECATGETYVNYWMHVNFLNDVSGKMSKSSGEFLTLQYLIDKGYDPLAYRYYLLTTHYRKEVTFTFDALDGATVAYSKIVEWCKDKRTPEGSLHTEYFEKIMTELSNDLSTPSCISQLWTLIKDDTVSDSDKYKTVLAISEVLGLSLEKALKENILVTEEVGHLLSERAKAREAKNFEESDRLRALIEEKGFIVKDNHGEQEISIK